MNKDGENRRASRTQKQQKTQQQVGSQKKKSEMTSKEMRPGACESAAPQGKRQGKESPTSPTAESGPGVHRKLSDASNTSEELSKDSGCLSAKLSSSDSDTELSWIDGRAYESPDSEGRETEAGPGAPQPGLILSPEGFMDMIMGETSEDLAREVEDLRSENEYLKDELEELRCEMLEMRDMFQEEEVFQLQQLRLQLDQANKTCRILQYRLRKAERRSIRVAQTGQVDGELVRSLEHDIKVAKSVSLRLYNELEAVQKKNSQLEWENEVVREKTQELEIAKQVLQTEAERARESSVKKRSSRSSSGRAEKRLSQIEDDSADLRCQLHFAKEELALMCKKLTKLVSDNEGMQDELSRYRSAYGDVHNAQLPDGQHLSARARVAEVKSHLKLVEEEATLLSRRIVELEVENRGLRAEMSDMREKAGNGAEEDEEGGEAGTEQDREAQMQRSREIEKDENIRPQTTPEPLVSEGKFSTCGITREGPVGGEWDPADSLESSDHNKSQDSCFKPMSRKNCETLLALRDHSCILSSAVQLLLTPSKNGHCSSPFVTETDLKRSHSSLPAPLNEALELFQTMLLAFIRRVEAAVIGEESLVWQPTAFAFTAGESAGNVLESPSKQECVEDLRTAEVKERQLKQGEHVHLCRDPNMQQCLRILWLLHQWRQEENETTSQSALELSGLLRDVAAQLQDEPRRFGRESEATRGTAAEPDSSSGVFNSDPPVSSRTLASSRARRYLTHRRSGIKNWCYTDQEAAQLDREEPVKTWDHALMPPSFPDLDFERMDLERSHTAPERTCVRIYYSPPSRRRVQAQAPLSPAVREKESVTSASQWFTPSSSFSPLALHATSNLSDDMKEITAGWRLAQEHSVNTSCSGTQTQTRPQMVSVALQTDSTLGPSTRSPSRVLGSPLYDRPTSTLSPIGRAAAERPRSTATSSPKLRRHSSSSLPFSSASTLSSSSSRERALWKLAQENHSGLAWTRQTGQRVAAGQNHGEKLNAKASASNKCGLVTEFLRRVSGRADKPQVQNTASRSKGSTVPKNLERVPTSRTSATPLQRSDSVTRIVNQRFMKQREERGLSHGVKPNQTPGEESNYECATGGSLTFCFSRRSGSNLRTTPHQSKVQPRRFAPPPSSCA